MRNYYADSDEYYCAAYIFKMKLNVVTVALTDQASEINYPFTYKSIRIHPEVWPNSWAHRL